MTLHRSFLSMLLALPLAACAGVPAVGPADQAPERPRLALSGPPSDEPGSCGDDCATAEQKARLEAVLCKRGEASACAAIGSAPVAPVAADARNGATGVPPGKAAKGAPATKKARRARNPS
jgi:hypothetical protein